LEDENHSYNQIVKSTSIFGGSQVITILIGIVRTKIIAILLGTLGVGLIGVYQSIVDMIRTIGGLGMDTGGVKEIATAEEAEDETTLQKSISVLNSWFRTTALIGALICVAFCFPISLWAFGDVDYALPIAGLSVCIFFTMLATGRTVIMQGLRRISFMAKSMILGSLFGLLTAIPLYYFFGLKGIIPALIIGSILLYASAEYYYRKLNIKTIKLEGKEVYRSGLSTLKLSLFIVLSSIINVITMFVIRAFLTKELSIESTGLFQSVWTIATIYIALILRSMGSDFFPRLSKIARNKDKIKKLVNEQTYIILIIITPAATALMLFSDFILTLLYSSDFTVASSILRWMVLGSFIRVLGWPISFILLAKNKGKMFLYSEIIFYAVYLLSVYQLFPLYGLDATGIGYLIAYMVYFPVLFMMGYRVSNFRWNGEVVRMALASIILMGIICCVIIFLESFYLYIAGGLVLILSLLFSLYKLKQVFSVDDLKNWFRRKD
jgi:PST family polysaccharide transporter